MTAVELTLKETLLGGGAMTDVILHNCRFEGAGARAYGREAILECFQRAPILLKASTVVRTERFAALFGTSDEGPIALFADLYDGHVARLWFLGQRPLTDRLEERIDVPFDFDLSEAGEGLAFDARDHPDLTGAHGARVIDMSKPFLPLRFGSGAIPVSEHARLARPRPIVLRAFSQGAATALLLSVHALRVDGRAGIVHFNAAVHMPTAGLPGAEYVVDEAQCAAELAHVWCPSL